MGSSKKSIHQTCKFYGISVYKNAGSGNDTMVAIGTAGDLAESVRLPDPGSPGRVQLPLIHVST